MFMLTFKRYGCSLRKDCLTQQGPANLAHPEVHAARHVRRQEAKVAAKSPQAPTRLESILQTPDTELHLSLRRHELREELGQNGFTLAASHKDSCSLAPSTLARAHVTHLSGFHGVRDRRILASLEGSQ